MDCLVLCSIKPDFVFMDADFKLISSELGELSDEEFMGIKEETREIFKILTTKGFYSGGYNETPPFLLYLILNKLGFVSKVFDKTGCGVDLLNIEKLNLQVSNESLN